MVKTRTTDPGGILQDLIDDSGLDPEDGVDTGQIDLTPLAREILRANRGGKTACMVVLQGPDVGSIIPVSREGVTIGRDPDCTSIMREEGISRTHALVKMKDRNKVIIRDLGSTNGTFVEGRRIKETVLKPGDKVLLGRNTVLKYMLQDQIDLVYQRELYDSSIRDGLTGIYNRRYLNHRIAADLSYARRHGIPLTFVMFDVDRFKEINDTYGHQTGDQILIALTRAISQMIRTEDVFARYGGEEFAIIANNIDFAGGKILGERVRLRIADQKTPALDDSGVDVSVTVSVGVTTVRSETVLDASAVISAADTNMFKAKEAGRNQVVASEIV
ncbi:MAG: diguanylate cyclase [Myxococcota bacterium]|nr:diguanylate cyclase [Myxococcota bacterium]